MSDSGWDREVAEGRRFKFGSNWARFLKSFSVARLAESEKSLIDLFGADLTGKTFLDIGCGSGLFSLAARCMGARVHSFDYDPQSVACAQELRHRLLAEDSGWSIERGSVLDEEYLHSLGQWDIVYSFGVLHHTGSMWRAIELAANTTKPGGMFFLAIYNDCGDICNYWLSIKRRYNSLHKLLRLPYVMLVWGPHEWVDFRHYQRSQGLVAYIDVWRQYRKSRGMSRWHDIIDWIGGYPYEWASRDCVREFLTSRGFVLDRVIENDGTGCNQFLFRRE